MEILNGLDRFFTTLIVDNTILFLLTIGLGLLMTAFPEVIKSGNFSKLKKFFY